MMSEHMKWGVFAVICIVLVGSLNLLRFVGPATQVARSPIYFIPRTDAVLSYVKHVDENLDIGVLCPNNTEYNLEVWHQISRNGPVTDRCFMQYAELACRVGVPFRTIDVPITQEDRIKQYVLAEPKTVPQSSGHVLPTVAVAGSNRYNKPAAPRVKILFTIMMHLGQNNTALSRGLLAAIYTPHHYYLFHCDYGGLNTSNADLEEFNQFKRDMEKYSNIFFLPKHETVQGAWSGVSLVFMELYLARKGYNTWSDWDYTINLSPTTLLLHPFSKLERFLETTQPMSYMDMMIILPETDWGWRTSKDRCQVECHGTRYDFLPSTCVFDRAERDYWSRFMLQSSQWKTLHRSVWHHLFTDPEARKQFERSWNFFRTTQITDERWLTTLFASLGMYEQFRIQKQSLVQIYWRDAKPYIDPELAVNTTRLRDIFFTRKVTSPMEQKQYYTLLRIPHSHL